MNVLSQQKGGERSTEREKARAKLSLLYFRNGQLIFASGKGGGDNHRLKQPLRFCFGKTRGGEGMRQVAKRGGLSN